MEFVQGTALLIGTFAFATLCLCACSVMLEYARAIRARVEPPSVGMRSRHCVCDICTNEWDINYPSYVDPNTLRVQCPNCQHVQGVGI